MGAATRTGAVAAVLVLGLALFGANAEAGGGPESTLLVVNEDSPLSLTLAADYARLRGIHPSHVCRLTGIPNLRVITIDQFRERILAPIRSYIADNGLEEEIDLIVYSADFPFGVNYDSDFKGEELGQGFQKFRVASLTGLTYHYRFVEQKSRGYLAFPSNLYGRVEGQGPRSAHGFRHRYVWTGDAEPENDPAKDSDARYYLSTVLAHTGLQGNTLAEARRYIEAAVGSDGTRPDGTVYLMEHKDIRAKTRMPFFDATEAALARLGRKSERLAQDQDGQDGRCPIDKKDAIGVVAGIATFNWEKCGSQLLPGSIAEHLTSFGAKFDGSGQTKISAYLRNGAAGSAGAVAEPYSIPHKFPLPFMHVYYAEGSSLAEAFFQSLLSPYQSLVIGEPLARPFALFAEVALEGPPTKAPWSGTVAVKAKVKPAKDRAIESVELWVDGQYVTEAGLGEDLGLDTAALDDGSHVLRLVAVEEHAIETRSSVVVPFTVKNGAHDVTIKRPRKKVHWGDEVPLVGKAPAAKTVALLHGTMVIAEAQVRSTTWKVKLPTAKLGVGTIPIVARATFAQGPATLSEPLELEIEAPAALKGKKRPKRGKKAPKGAGGKGLLATVTDATGEEQTFAMPFIGRQGKNAFLKDLRAKVKGKPSSIVLVGEVEVKQEGFYRLAINAQGKMVIRVRGEEVFAGEELAFDRQRHAGMTLEAGWHAIEVEYEPSGNGDLSLQLGGAQVSALLGGNAIRH